MTFDLLILFTTLECYIYHWPLIVIGSHNCGIFVQHSYILFSLMSNKNNDVKSGITAPN